MSIRVKGFSFKVIQGVVQHPTFKCDVCGGKTYQDVELLKSSGAFDYSYDDNAICTQCKIISWKAQGSLLRSGRKIETDYIDYVNSEVRKLKIKRILS